MFVSKRDAFRALCCAFLLSGVAFAQEVQKPQGRSQTTGVPITASASGGLVRFAAVGAVERMRLEVFDAAGEPVFDTGFKPGNLRDWRLTNARGRRLTEGSFPLRRDGQGTVWKADVQAGRYSHNKWAGFSRFRRRRPAGTNGARHGALGAPFVIARGDDGRGARRRGRTGHEHDRLSTWSSHLYQRLQRTAGATPSATTAARAATRRSVATPARRQAWTHKQKRKVM